MEPDALRPVAEVALRPIDARIDALKQILAGNKGEIPLEFEIPAAQGVRKVAYKNGIAYNYDLKKTLRRKLPLG